MKSLSTKYMFPICTTDKSTEDYWTLCCLRKRFYLHLCHVQSGNFFFLAYIYWLIVLIKCREQYLNMYPHSGISFVVVVRC